MLLGVGALAGVPAWAQVGRLFPQGTERAKITFERETRMVRVDGKPERLGPGVQIRDSNGRSPIPSTLAGQTVLAHYVRDASGAIFRIWILTPQEAQMPAPDKLRRQGWQPAAEPNHYLN